MWVTMRRNKAVWFVFCIFISGISTASPRALESPGQDESFAILVDAGSSGSRVHIFSMVWLHGSSLPDVRLPSKKLKVEPGLSDFANEPEKAGQSLSVLLDFALKSVPEHKRHNTPFVIAGTAGLRLLSDDVAGKILKSCEDFVRSQSSFQVHSRVITGTEEGVFGWLSVNFLAGRLRGMNNEHMGTLGAAEVGGASMQLTFQYDSATDYNKPPFTVVQLGKASYMLYSHSYLGLGQDEVRHTYNTLRESQVDDPCFPKGYVVAEGTSVNDVYRGRPHGGVRGTGNYNECRKLLRDLVMGEGSRHVCEVEPCAIQGVHQPRFWERGNAGKLVAFEHFRHTARALGLVPGAADSLLQDMGGLESGNTVRAGEFNEAAKRVCSTEWEVLSNSNEKLVRSTAHRQCFSAVFLSVLLEDGLGLPSDSEMQVLAQINQVDIDWPIGMLLSSISSPHHPPQRAPALHSTRNAVSTSSLLGSEFLSLAIPLIGVLVLVSLLLVRWQHIRHLCKLHTAAASSALSPTASDKLKTYSNNNSNNNNNNNTSGKLIRSNSGSLHGVQVLPATPVSGNSPPMSDSGPCNWSTYGPSVSRSLQSTRMRNSSNSDLLSAAKLTLTPSSSFREAMDD